MSIVIDDPDLERHLRALAAERGESVEDVVRDFVGGTTGGEVGSESVIASRGESERARRERWAEVQRIIDRFAALEAEDSRTPDEILGYDEHGLPT
jgi:antitoxin VapB